MEDELYCAEQYRGFNIFVESWWAEDGATPKLEFSGEVVDDEGNTVINIGSNKGGEVCLDACKDYIDELLNEDVLD